MDSNLVYAKTPIGDEAVRQSTRVVQRNLRMVLVQVDGKMSVAELAAKIGNPRLVESAIRELEKGGYIAPTVDAVSVWEESKRVARQEAELDSSSPMSEFSTFGPKSVGPQVSKGKEISANSIFSFGKPVPSSTSMTGAESIKPVVIADTSEATYRQGMSAGRKVLLATGAIIAILVVTVIFYPYEQFKPALEASATRMLNAPVKIERVGIAFFPSLSLKLSGVRVGELAEGKIEEVRIASPLYLLGSRPHQLPRVEASGVTLAANRLVSLPMFLGGTAGDREVIIRKILIDRIQLSLGDGLVFNDLFGEIIFRKDGVLEKAHFETVDRRLMLEAQPGNQGIALNIEGRAWTPAGAAFSFASLQAKGFLQRNRLQIQNIDTTFLGGILRGNWVLDWSNGLSMAGDGTLSRLDTRNISAAFAPSLKIEGDMSGNVRLQSSGNDWESLWGGLEAVLVTEITRGTFHGVDLGEAVRRGGVAEVRAGSTKFDRLRSTINITPKQVVGRDVRMDAGMVTAVGQFSAGRNAQVDGNMAVTMQTSVSSQSASVHIYGVLPDLSATTRK